jgi:single-strand DNA-binding protein
MSTRFYGEGNIGSAPEVREFPNGNEEPRRLLRLNVHFDNPVPRKDGEYEDRGGFWAPVELWHREAGHWQTLYQKGMRVLVEGRMLRDGWEDEDGAARVTYRITARAVGHSAPSGRGRHDGTERPRGGGSASPIAASRAAFAPFHGTGGRGEIGETEEVPERVEVRQQGRLRQVFAALHAPSCRLLCGFPAFRGGDRFLEGRALGDRGHEFGFVHGVLR